MKRRYTIHSFSKKLKPNLTEEERNQAKVATGDDFLNFCKITPSTTDVWYEIPMTENRQLLLKSCHGNFHISAKATVERTY